MRMVRPSIESRYVGEPYDGLEIEKLLHDQAVTRDDFVLVARLMAIEIVRLAQMPT